MLNGANNAEICMYAFANCTALERITLSDNLYAIKYNAFEGCSSLLRIVIPGNVNTIGNHAFLNCSALQSAELKAGVKKISEGAFKNCIGLQSVILNEGLTTIGTTNTVYYKDGAFENCPKLTRVTIPASVTLLGENSFFKCTGLKSAIFLGAVPTTWGTDVFRSNDGGFILYYIPGTDAAWRSPTWTAPDDSIYRTAVWSNEPRQYTVSGKITSFGAASDAITVRVLNAEGVEVDRQTAENNTYRFTLTAGTYTLEISKKNHVTRRYTVQIAPDF